MNQLYEMLFYVNYAQERGKNGANKERNSSPLSRNQTLRMEILNFQHVVFRIWIKCYSLNIFEERGNKGANMGKKSPLCQNGQIP